MGIVDAHHSCNRCSADRTEFALIQTRGATEAHASMAAFLRRGQVGTQAHLQTPYQQDRVDLVLPANDTHIVIFVIVIRRATAGCSRCCWSGLIRNFEVLHLGQLRSGDRGSSRGGRRNCLARLSTLELLLQFLELLDQLYLIRYTLVGSRYFDQTLLVDSELARFTDY